MTATSPGSSMSRATRSLSCADRSTSRSCRLTRTSTTAEVGGIAERPAVERVLQIHTRYREPGGEERVVEAERQLLEGAGLSVRQVMFDNAELRESRSLAGDLRIAASAIWSRSAPRRVRAVVEAYRPHVVHVHNTF